MNGWNANITALFICIARDLSPTSCHRQFHLKLNSFGYDILIGTLFPLIEQIRETLLGEKVISGRCFRIHNLELKISCLALFVWEPGSRQCTQAAPALKVSAALKAHIVFIKSD